MGDRYLLNYFVKARLDIVHLYFQLNCRVVEVWWVSEERRADKCKSNIMRKMLTVLFFKPSRRDWIPLSVISLQKMPNVESVCLRKYI